MLQSIINWISVNKLSVDVNKILHERKDIVLPAFFQNVRLQLFPNLL